jgi:mannose-6-phosphate isomerase-like protein (cupin superfamily)
MSGYRARAIDDLPTLWDGFAKLVRPGMGIEAFGANIMDLPPDYSTKSHDEADSGQQELYVALRGSGAVVIGEERLPLDGEHLVVVDAGTDRVLSSDSDGLRVLVVGAVPGAAYDAPDWSSTGE